MWHDFVKMLYPELCMGCGKSLARSEKHVCVGCFDRMAFCPYMPAQMHPVEKIFWGRCRIEAAQSLLLFSKQGVAQSMLHRLKYQGEEQVGEFLGSLLGRKLKAHPAIASSELIIPLPLHEKKLRQRGYNQSEVIARGMSKEMEIPVLTNLLTRPGLTESQTRKSRIERVENVSRAFAINLRALPEATKVLLVDDVITTGATLEACLRLLEPHFKVCVATLAYQ
jgi:ComF family protein